MLNRYARYNFRSRLPGWLEHRASRIAKTGNTTRALYLIDLQYRAENWLTENSPVTIEEFSK